MVLPEIQIISANQNALNLALIGLVAFMASGYVVIALVYARARGRTQAHYAVAPGPVMAQYVDRPSEKSAL